MESELVAFSKVFSLYPNLLGKIYSVTFYRSLGKRPQCGKRRVHENASFPCLDFLVSSVQFSVNKRELLPRLRVSDAPSKLDNAKRSQMTDLRL